MFNLFRQHIGPIRAGELSGLSLGSGLAIGMKVDDSNLRGLTRRFGSRVSAETRRKIIRDEMKRWGRDTRAAARRRCPKVTGRLARDIVAKFKTYKGGLINWAGVGGRLVRAPRDREIWGKDYLGAGWRMHFISRDRRKRQPGTKNYDQRPRWYRSRLKRAGGVIKGDRFLDRIASITRRQARVRIIAALRKAAG